MSDLLIRPEVFRNRIENFGFEFLSLEARKLEPARAAAEKPAPTNWPSSYSAASARSRVHVASGSASAGGATVFDGMPYTLYLPVNTTFTVTADTDCDLAFCYCRAEEEHPGAPGHAGRGGHRDPRRRQRHAPDQQHAAAELSRASPDRCRGLHARGQLVQLSAAQARRAQSSGRSRPGRNLLLPRSSGRRVLRFRRSTPPTAASTKPSRCATASWC